MNEERDEEIRKKRYKDGWKIKELMEHYKLSIGTISKICNPHTVFPRLRQERCGFRQRREVVGVEDFIKLKVAK